MQKHFGDNLSPAVKYWVFLVGIITVIFTVLLGSFAASYLNLSADEQAIFEPLFDKLIPFPFVGSIVLVAFICTIVSLLFRHYIIPVLRMAEQTRLITAATRIIASQSTEPANWLRWLMLSMNQRTLSRRCREKSMPISTGPTWPSRKNGIDWRLSCRNCPTE